MLNKRYRRYKKTQILWLEIKTTLDVIQVRLETAEKNIKKHMNRNFLKENTKRKETFVKILVSSGTTLRDLKEMYNWSSQRREKTKNIWRNNDHNFPKINKNYKSISKMLNKTPRKKIKHEENHIILCPTLHSIIELFKTARKY